MQQITTYQEEDFPSHIHKLKELYIKLFSGGKGFRAQLVSMVSDPLEIEENKKICLQKVIEYIHNSSLLHDDLIDQSPLRRGKTAAWREYGADHAVLAGDYLLAKVISLLCEQNNVRLVSYTADVIMELLEGEWLQDDIKGDLNISREKMDRIHNLKTASLKKWGLRAPFYSIGRNEKGMHDCLEETGRLMGILFQRADDLLDYNIRNKEEKAILGDHKAQYLNSFALFLLEEKTIEERKKFLERQDLKEIQNFIGEKTWAEKVEAFDEENKNLLQKYDEELKKLSAYLSKKEQPLIQELEPLGHLLYWRHS